MKQFISVYCQCVVTLLVLLIDASWGWTFTTAPSLRLASSTSPRRTARQLPSGTSFQSPPSPPRRAHRLFDFVLYAIPGADIEQPSVDDDETTRSTKKVTADSTGDLATRGKKNEIDFTVAPADVSLSRAYGPPASSSQQSAAATTTDSTDTTQTEPVVSLTLALNNASNRAVRRIILARSWPSAEALNLSLRRVAAAERQASADNDAAAKCPVPRPILNVLTRNRQRREHVATTSRGSNNNRKSRTDEEYVADQLRAFRERYGTLPHYEQAEDYLEAVLSLATSGVESPRAPSSSSSSSSSSSEAQPQLHAYHDSYRRLLGVLRTVGVVLEENERGQQRVISKQLNDHDLCLSMLDRIQMEREQRGGGAAMTTASAFDKLDAVDPTNEVTDKEDDQTSKEASDNAVDTEGPIVRKPRVKFFGGNNNNNKQATEKAQEKTAQSENISKEQSGLNRDDLGGVLLSAKEPSMTRQLNVLSNIVLRALLFGGDQELLVLAETLDADRAAFVQRWYPRTGGLLNDGDLQDENRPGVQYLNCLIDLLRECYDHGIVVDLQPSLPLSQSYANAYERLVAMAVELGSGYLKPILSSNLALPKPRTAKEELGRLALWESRFRQKAGTPDISPYPEDLEGLWEVRDEVGGDTIGTTRVTLSEEGEVIVDPPLEGLRWRLDPGPTHLDTCTFQVLNTDGTILQYRGFIDRGARLEARFSKRAMRIRGSVMFQMRDGSVDYYKDILPINYREGTTKFVMTKVFPEE